MKPNKIKLNKNNPRLIKDDKYKKLVKSLKEFPEMATVRPVVIDENNVILGGNMRYKAMIEAGWEDIPVHQVTNWTEEQKKEFIVKDNLGFGDWDYDVLANDYDLTDLEGWGMEIAEDLLPVKEVEEDEPPQVDEVNGPVSKLGEVYQLGRHKLVCGDSTKIEDVDKLMDGNKADMVFTDPPYGYEYKSNYQSKHKQLLNDDNFLDFLPLSTSFSQDNSAHYICCGWQTVHVWRKMVEDNGLEVKNMIIWKKNNWSMGDLKGAYAGQYEIILFVHKGRVTLDNGRDRDVWEFDRVPPTDHPTMKPVGLVSRAINNHMSNTVLDLFGGSGSTLIACEQTNRTCYMMELDLKYCDVIRKRYHKFVTGSEEGWIEATS